MTRRVLRLQYFAWGAYLYLMGLLPYFPTPEVWKYVVDIAETERDRVRAELDEVQP